MAIGGRAKHICLIVTDKQHSSAPMSRGAWPHKQTCGL